MSIEFICDSTGHLRHKKSGKTSPFHMVTGAAARRARAKKQFRKNPVSARGDRGHEMSEI
jgi:hypothetical protein